MYNHRTQSLNLLLFALFLTLSACSSYATIGIPAKQEFVLGEQSGKNFKVELKNLSTETVEVKTVNKQTGEKIQSFGLAGNGKAELFVSRKEKVFLSNPHEVDINVKAVLNKGVEGMRYQDIKN